MTLMSNGMPMEGSTCSPHNKATPDGKFSNVQFHIYIKVQYSILHFLRSAPVNILRLYWSEQNEIYVLVLIVGEQFQKVCPRERFVTPKFSQLKVSLMWIKLPTNLS